MVSFCVYLCMTHFRRDAPVTAAGQGGWAWGTEQKWQFICFLLEFCNLRLLFGKKKQEKKTQIGTKIPAQNKPTSTNQSKTNKPESTKKEREKSGESRNDSSGDLFSIWLFLVSKVKRHFSAYLWKHCWEVMHLMKMWSKVSKSESRLSSKLTMSGLGPVSWRPMTVKWWQFSQSNRHSTIGAWQTEYNEALQLSANDEVSCDCTFADVGNASWYSVCRVPMVEWRLDCENYPHLTVIGLHDTGPWSSHQKSISARNSLCALLSTFINCESRLATANCLQHCKLLLLKHSVEENLCVCMHVEVVDCG